MNEGVVAVDSRRRLLFANEAAERLFGLGTGSVGRLVAELVRSPRVQEAVDLTLAGPGTHRTELVLSGTEGRATMGPRNLSVQGTPLPGSPPPGAVLVFHDVTDLRRLERMRQDFVANASHELKTPLASIKAYTETLMDGALDDTAVNLRFLGQIDEQADRLNQLIQDLLSLARIEAGASAFHHAPLRLGPVVRKIAEAHRSRAEAKGLTYVLNLPAGEGPLVRADDEAVRQILDNLIDNAVKYTPERGRIVVDFRSGPESALLEVKDTGIGIPRDDLPRVFERFYRVDKARSRELGGTGLGLSIVKNLVVSLGGRVTVESRVGEGSTFRLELPRLDVER
jgi:two-component system phosphate regulon sensor histidine kinase PhoR